MPGNLDWLVQSVQLTDLAVALGGGTKGVFETDSSIRKVNSRTTDDDDDDDDDERGRRWRRR